LNSDLENTTDGNSGTYVISLDLEYSFFATK
jgi:hypothetical protein